MKFKIAMGDREGIDTAARAAVWDELSSMDWYGNLSADEVGAMVRTRLAKLREVLSQWFEEGEYLTVEVDTEANTCVIVSVR